MAAAHRWPKLSLWALLGLGCFFCVQTQSIAAVSAQDERVQIKQRVNQILRDPALRGAKVGVVLKTLKGETVIESGADQLLNPASNVKLITTLAALKVLKPEYRFKTDYLGGPLSKNGILSTLYVKGYGDPSIVTERLYDVARKLRLHGINKINRIVLDTSSFVDEPYPKGFEADTSRAFAAPIGALSINRNTVEIYVRPMEVGMPALVSPEPPVDLFEVQGQIATSAKGYSPSISSASVRGHMVIDVSGKVSPQVAPRSYLQRVEAPARYFGDVLVYALKREGILVQEPLSFGFVQPDASLLYQDLSLPLARLVADVNQYSSNFMAEMLVKALAAGTGEPASFANGLKVVRAFLEKEVHFKPGSYVLGNGSGLGHVNQFSARQLSDVLSYAANNFDVASDYMASLGVSGTQGTLRRRLKGPNVVRRIRAKTGTLNRVSALSGYLAAQGSDVMIFSILIDGFHGYLGKMWQLEDALGAAFVGSSDEQMSDVDVASLVQDADTADGG